MFIGFKKILKGYKNVHEFQKVFTWLQKIVTVVQTNVHWFHKMVMVVREIVHDRAKNVQEV
jgi:hypothetical protein